jgi:hypothetical protein
MRFERESMRLSLTMLFLLVVVFGTAKAAWAAESQVVFLPAGHVFEPLMADLREPNTSIALTPDFKYYDGALGGTLDLVRWNPSDGSHWAWGALGSGYLYLINISAHALGQSYRLEDIDLWMGTYLSESLGLFSNRLEYLHGASHLGDQYFFTDLQPIAYIRDGLQLTDSFRPSECLRLFVGLGYWLYAAPPVPPLFIQVGTEIYSAYSPFDGNRVRGFFAYDLKVGNEELGVADQNFELGIQWKGFKEAGPSLRLALTYYNGNSLYGQFYGQKDNHWGLAFFVDP